MRRREPQLSLEDAAQMTPPAELDGHSFVPVLKDAAASIRDHALSQFPRPWRPNELDVMGYSIRTPTHRYTRWLQWPARKTVAEELYDYESPDSAHGGALVVATANVLDHPAHAETRDRLRTKMDEVLQTRVQGK